MYSYNGRRSVRCFVLLTADSIKYAYFSAIQKKIALFSAFFAKIYAQYLQKSEFFCNFAA